MAEDSNAEKPDSYYIELEKARTKENLEKMGIDPSGGFFSFNGEQVTPTAARGERGLNDQGYEPYGMLPHSNQELMAVHPN